MGLGHLPVGISRPPLAPSGNEPVPLLFGTAAQRPAAQAQYQGWYYAASDVGGGTIYQCQWSNGSGFSWVVVAGSGVGTFQPLDATLTALAAANWAANSIPVGTGADTVAQMAFAASTFLMRGAAGDLAAKTITFQYQGLLDGTLTVGANNFYAGGESGSAVPAFRTLVTADLPSQVVTFAKIQNINTDRLIGRDTAGSGSPEELSVGGGLEFTGSAGIQRSALTGDVTATTGLNSTTIANDAVTNAKAANMAQATIKGRADGAGTGDPTDLTATQAQTILRTVGGDNPAGTIAGFGASSIPTGWLECIGTAVSRSTYADLFAVIGTTWGAGDGSTTFNLPDMRGRTPIGVGTGSGLTARTLAGTGGAETHTLVTGEMPAHNHGISVGVIPGYEVSGGVFNSTGGSEKLSVATITNTGGGGAHANMQPWVAVKWMIKT